MLEIKNLTIKINEKNYVNQLSLVLNKQDKLAIIGEEGNGKSTLLKAIVGEANFAGISGSIHTFSHTIGYLKQSLEQPFGCVKDFLFIDDEDYYLQINIFYQLLNTLQLHDVILEQDISHLSGGEKVKLQLLKLLLRDPQILLLDEPTNDLDIETLNWLEHFILTCDKPIMFISHDETLLSHCANQILHLEQRNKQTKCKHTLYIGNYDDYIKQRYHLHGKEEQIARKEKTLYKQKQEQLNNIRNAVHDALNDTVRNPGQAALLKKKMRNVKAQEKRFEKEGYSQVDSLEEHIKLFFPAINLANRKTILAFHQKTLYADDHYLAKNLTLNIVGPKHIAIIGHNGCGKTTLLHAIKEHLKIHSTLPFGYMPQNYDLLLPSNQTPIDFLSPTCHKDEITNMRKWLGSVNFTRDEMMQSINHLSGGSKAKLILLSLIKHAYPILLLDEPTRNVSPLSNPIIRNALEAYEGCIISISHDRKYIKQVCDEVYELKEDGLHLIDKESL